MLAYILSYATKDLLRKIMERANSLTANWSVLWKWAGIQPTGLMTLEYARMQNTWDPASDVTPSKFF